MLATGVLLFAAADADCMQADAPTTPSIAALPLPSPDKINLSFSGTPLPMVLARLSQVSQCEIRARGKLSEQRVTLLARNQKLEQVLNQLTAQILGAVVRHVTEPAELYEIWDQESYRQEVLPTLARQKVFVPHEILAEDAFKAIQGILTPGLGSATFDARSNKLFVTDLPEVLMLAQQLIAQIDVSFATRVFHIRRNDMDGIVEQISQLKSPAAPEPEVDERTHQIIVRDRLEVIRKMELLVDTLDDSPRHAPLRVYSAGAGASLSSGLDQMDSQRRGQRVW